MIAVSRGEEPLELRKVRRVQLARAILAFKKGLAPSFDGYDVAKTVMVDRLHRKCSYCEMPLRKDGNPVEHFRPKTGVQNTEDQGLDRSRYWWLAWTWENLLFACGYCNTIYKKNQFPLVAGAVPLAAESVEVDSEQSLLIDPARIDPREHIRFRENKDGRWLPFPVHGSKMGKETIFVLGLDQEDDHRAAHVRDRVLPAVEQILESIALGQGSHVSRTWKRTMQTLFSDGMPFHSVTWDVLEKKIPQAIRAQWNLTLPVLGQLGLPATTPLFDPADDPAEFASLDEELRLTLRALGDTAEWPQVQAALTKLREKDPAWTKEQLACLLGRTVSTVDGYLKKLGESTHRADA